MTARPEALPTAVGRAPVVSIAAEPGRVLGLVGPPGSGLTRLGLALLSAAPVSGWVAAIDVRGWLSPKAAWEVGVEADRLVVVRCSEQRLWPRVVAALLEGLGAVYAEVPGGVPDQVLRRLGALARSRRAALLLRPVQGSLPSGLAHLHLAADRIEWEGAVAGHGSLTTRRLSVRASGRGTGGIERIIEVEDDGTNAVRVVPELVPSPGRRVAG